MKVLLITPTALALLGMGMVAAHDHGKHAVQDTLDLGVESAEALEKKWGFEVCVLYLSGFSFRIGVRGDRLPVWLFEIRSWF